MFELNYKKTTDDIAKWLKTTVHAAGFSKVIVAVSGGIDSAVSVTLAAQALGKENVYCVLLPYGLASKEHAEDAKEVLSHLQIPQENIFEIDIKPSVDVILNEVKDLPITNQKILRQMPQNDKTKELDNMRKGNIMARARMIYLFDLAKKLNVLVCGTENKTEHFLGYFTRFGDSASDLEPIKSLYKTQIWEIGKFLGIPEKIIKKAPTAGLWENQTDEGEFGFSYKEADKVLYYHFDEKLTKEQIEEKGIESKVIEMVLDRVQKNEFKHKLPHEFK